MLVYERPRPPAEGRDDEQARKDVGRNTNARRKKIRPRRDKKKRRRMKYKRKKRNARNRKPSQRGKWARREWTSASGRR